MLSVAMEVMVIGSEQEKRSSGWFASLIASIFIEATPYNHQFLSLSNEYSLQYLHQTNLDVPFLCSMPILHFTLVCCATLSCIETTCCTNFIYHR